MIEQLFKLEILNGSFNQINEFPDFLSKLNQIKEINLEGFFFFLFFIFYFFIFYFWEHNKWLKDK